MQNGGVEFVEVYGIAGDVVAEIIGGAVGDAGLDAAAGHPHTEVARVMVAPIIFASEFALTINRAAKLAAEHDERVVEHTALLEVFDERGGRLVDIHALVFDVRGQRAVLIPAAMENLHHVRTPRSMSRRVRSAECAKVPGFWALGPYISRVALLSFPRSVSSGTLVCMRKAISYWAMRVCVSGSPKRSKVFWFNLPSASSIARRSPGTTPGGFFTYKTGSPLPRSFTPSNLDGKKPLVHMRVNRAWLGFLTVGVNTRNGRKVLAFAAETVAEP